jgi:hypothetical protein
VVHLPGLRTKASPKCRWFQAFLARTGWAVVEICPVLWPAETLAHTMLRLMLCHQSRCMQIRERAETLGI